MISNYVTHLRSYTNSAIADTAAYSVRPQTSPHWAPSSPHQAPTSPYRAPTSARWAPISSHRMTSVRSPTLLPQTHTSPHRVPTPPLRIELRYCRNEWRVFHDDSQSFKSVSWFFTSGSRCFTCDVFHNVLLCLTMFYDVYRVAQRSASPHRRPCCCRSPQGSWQRRREWQQLRRNRRWRHRDCRYCRECDPILNSVLNGLWSNSVPGSQIPDGLISIRYKCWAFIPIYMVSRNLYIWFPVPYRAPKKSIITRIRGYVYKSLCINSAILLHLYGYGSESKILIFIMLTDNNQIFRNCVIIYCHLTKVSSQISKCIIFELNELSITLSTLSTLCLDLPSPRHYRHKK